MVSRTALICRRYAAGCTKKQAEILQPQNSEKELNAPGKAQKGRNRMRSGCWRGWERLRTGENGWESLAIGQKDLSRLPARSGLDAAHWAAGPLGTRFWSGCGKAHWGNGGGAVLPGFQRKSGRGRCWFGAMGNFPGQNGRKRAGNPRKNVKYY